MLLFEKKSTLSKKDLSDYEAPNIILMSAVEIGLQPLQFPEHDHMIQQLPPAASDPAFCNSVLPGASI